MVRAAYFFVCGVWVAVAIGSIYNCGQFSISAEKIVALLGGIAACFAPLLSPVKSWIGKRDGKEISDRKNIRELFDLVGPNFLTFHQTHYYANAVSPNMTDLLEEIHEKWTAPERKFNDVHLQSDLNWFLSNIRSGLEVFLVGLHLDNGRLMVPRYEHDPEGERRLEVISNCDQASRKIALSYEKLINDSRDRFPDVFI